MLKDILEVLKIADVTANNIYEALDSNWYDFEDSVQYTVAKSISADYIITRNPNDFLESEIEVISPEEFIERIIE